MAVIAVQSIHVYPIKSSAGIALSTSWVETLGLAFDRRFVVANHQGEMFTARTKPRLCLIKTHLTASGLAITAPGMSTLIIEYHKFTAVHQNVTVWGTNVNAQLGLEHYNRWFSQYLNTPCRLLFFGDKTERLVKNRNTPVSFADGYPLLLISQQSLNRLNQTLAVSNPKSPPVNMAQFRPNIVVKGGNSFDEDSWKKLKIGDVEFEVTSPCSRCIFTTIDPVTAQKNTEQEPLKTLKSFRQVESGEVMFGQNLIPLNEGHISTDDKVEVIASKKAPVFFTPKADKFDTLSPTFVNSNTLVPTSSTRVPTEKIRSTTPVSPTKKANNKNMTTPNKKPKLDFSSWNKNLVGNNKETLLEQGENAGLILPYSCRGGMCGRCKIKLESGNVRQLATDGLSDQDKTEGYVLACSSVPTSDVVLAKAPR